MQHKLQSDEEGPLLVDLRRSGFHDGDVYEYTPKGVLAGDDDYMNAYDPRSIAVQDLQSDEISISGAIEDLYGLHYSTLEADDPCLAPALDSRYVANLHPSLGLSSWDHHQRVPPTYSVFSTASTPPACSSSSLTHQTGPAPRADSAASAYAAHLRSISHWQSTPSSASLYTDYNQPYIAPIAPRQDATDFTDESLHGQTPAATTSAVRYDSNSIVPSPADFTKPESTWRSDLADHFAMRASAASQSQRVHSGSNHQQLYLNRPKTGVSHRSQPRFQPLERAVSEDTQFSASTSPQLASRSPDGMQEEEEEDTGAWMYEDSVVDDAPSPVNSPPAPAPPSASSDYGGKRARRRKAAKRQESPEVTTPPRRSYIRLPKARRNVAPPLPNAGFFGDFTQAVDIYDSYGNIIDLDPSLEPPAYVAFANDVSAWLAYRRNHLNATVSLTLPKRTNALYTSPDLSKSPRISQLVVSFQAFTLHEPPQPAALLQLDSSRALSTSKPLKPQTQRISATTSEYVFTFSRVQFAKSTSNHPATKGDMSGMTTHVWMQVLLEGIVDSGSSNAKEKKVVIGQWDSALLVVRGRSPKKFSAIGPSGTVKGGGPIASGSSKMTEDTQDRPQKPKKKAPSNLGADGDGNNGYTSEDEIVPATVDPQPSTSRKRQLASTAQEAPATHTHTHSVAKRPRRSSRPFPKFEDE